MTPARSTIAVIDTHPARASIIEEGLRKEGYHDVHVLTELRGLAAHLSQITPDVIIMDLGHPNRDMLESIFQVTRVVKRPVAMFVDSSDQASIEAAVDAGVSAYIVDGLRQERVKPILDLAVSRFNAFSRMARELEEVRNELAERKVIERAKAILMKTRSIGEDEAYRLMRSTAMNQNRKIVDIAESIVTAASLFETGKK